MAPTLSDPLRWLGMLLLVLVALPSAAQQSGSIKPNDAYMWRQLRSLEGQMRTSPDSAALQLQRTRRELLQQSHGGAFTPEQLRINRDLDRIGRELQQERTRAGNVPSRPDTRSEPLPSSYATHQPLPSFHRAATVGRLLDRAETALAQGGRAQAQSDLSTARDLMAGVTAADVGGDKELAALQARMGTVQARLAAPGG